MMQDVPPPPPGFQIVGQSGSVPPPPPGFQLEQQAPRQAPRQTPRQAPAQAPAQMPSDPVGTGYTQATAITGSDTPEMMRAKLRAGRVPEAEINAIMAQYEADLAGGRPYDVVSSQELSPEDTPERLRAAGYEIDPIRNVWARVVGTQPLPAPLSDERNPASPGYALAVEQELAKAEAMPGYADVGFTDQATAPLNDELAFAIGYAQQGLANFGRGLFGGQNDVSALDRARAMRDINQENQAQYEQERPVSSFLGQALGGFALAPTRVAGAGQAFMRPGISQGYRQAAGAGAAYGAAEGNSVQERLGMGALGAGAGVATAGLLDAGIGGIAGLARRIGGESGPALSAPERRLSQTLGRVARESNTLTADEFLAQIPDGGLPLDIDAPLMEGVVRAAAQTPGPARQAIRETATSRRAEASNRFRSGIEESLGGSGNYFATLDQNIQARRNASREVLDVIADQTYRPGDNAVRALRSDFARNALRERATLLANDPTPEAPFEAARIQRIIQQLDDPVTPQIEMDVATAQDVSRAIREASDAAWRSNEGGRGSVLGRIGQAIRDDARESVPAYRQWLARYGEDSDNIQALELGRRALQSLNDSRPDGTSAEVLRRQFNELSDVGKDMFRKGVGEALVAQARATGDFQTMRRILRSDEMADRIKVAFPDEQSYTRFLNGIEAEVAMANRDNMILGGSPTAFNQQAIRMMGGTPLEDSTNRSWSGVTLTGVGAEIGRQGARLIGRGIDRSRSVLQNPQSNEALGRALTDADYIRMLLQSSLTRRPGLFGGYAPAGVAAATQNRLSPVQ